LSSSNKREASINYLLGQLFSFPSPEHHQSATIALVTCARLHLTTKLNAALMKSPIPKGCSTPTKKRKFDAHGSSEEFVSTSTKGTHTITPSKLNGKAPLDGLFDVSLLQPSFTYLKINLLVAI
jgi:hypothetical protein